MIQPGPPGVVIVVGVVSSFAVGVSQEGVCVLPVVEEHVGLEVSPVVLIVV